MLNSLIWVLIILGIAVVAIAGFATGVLLGIKYLGLLSSRVELPQWTVPLRTGWFFFALATSTMLYFQEGPFLAFGLTLIPAALLFWFVASNEKRKLP